MWHVTTVMTALLLPCEVLLNVLLCCVNTCLVIFLCCFILGGATNTEESPIGMVTSGLYDILVMGQGYKWCTREEQCNHLELFNQTVRLAFCAHSADTVHSLHTRRCQYHGWTVSTLHALWMVPCLHSSYVICLFTTSRWSAGTRTPFTLWDRKLPRGRYGSCS